MTGVGELFIFKMGDTRACILMVIISGDRERLMNKKEKKTKKQNSKNSLPMLYTT